MAFEDIKDNAEQLKNEANNYLNSSIKYLKLWGFKVGMQSLSVIVRALMIIIFLTLTFIFLSVAAALAIGYALDNFVYGFLIMAGFYFLLLIVVYFSKNRLIEGPLLRKFSSIFFND